MRGWVKGRSWPKVLTGVGLIGAAVFAVCWGRGGDVPQGTAAAPEAPPAVPQPAPAAEPAGEYARRPVAYIYGDTPVTREQLGEYLIARMGAERLNLLINRLIIERECRENGIEVTEGEVQAALADDLKELNVPLNDFVSKVLKQYNKTLYEWKEDVIWPKLAITKLCRQQNRVRVTEKEIQEAYNGRYGERVQCRVILIPQAEADKVAFHIHAKVKDSEAEFMSAASHQADQMLSARGGQFPPIGKGTAAPGYEEFERVAFSLKEGEVSHILAVPGNVAILKCDKHLPPDPTKKIETERAALEKEIMDRKIQKEVPALFQELRKKARPDLYLAKRVSETDLVNSVQRELQAPPPGAIGTPAPLAPRGN